MRVTQSITNPGELNNRGEEALASPPTQPRPEADTVHADTGLIRFGQSGANACGVLQLESPAVQAQASPPNSLAALVGDLINGLRREANGGRGVASGLLPHLPKSQRVSIAPTPLSQSNGTQAPRAASAEARATSKSSEAGFLDNSKFSSPAELKKYDALVSHLKPSEREQAAKELNRPIAAAKMAAEDGPNSASAKAFIESNPALKRALDTAKRGGKPDGSISNGDYKSFIKNMEGAAKAASHDLEKYTKQNSDQNNVPLDPQSLAMVRNAALLRANEPLAKAGAVNSDGKVDRYITGDALKGLQDGNPGLSSALAQAAKTFSQPGFLQLLDQGGLEGESLATHSADQKISTKNIDDWIKKQAPTNGGQFAAMMSDAATRNAVAHVDLGNPKLTEDVFKNPQNYSGDQKAAVMVKLQSTLEQVEGGRKLRKVENTTQALQQKISQLQADPDTKVFLKQMVPIQTRSLIDSDPTLVEAVNKRGASVASGATLQSEMDKAKRVAAEENKGKNPAEQKAVDYSQAIGNLDAELQFLTDLKGESAILTTAQILDRRPLLKKEIERSYQENFVSGKAVEAELKQDNKTSGRDILVSMDQKKLAYETAIPKSATNAAQDGYVEATMRALTITKKGMEIIKDLKVAGTLPKDADVTKMNAKQMYSQLRDNVEKQTSAAGLDTKGKISTVGGAAFSVGSLAMISSQLEKGDTSGAVKSVYDAARGTAEIGKVGYAMIAHRLGKDASAGLGRMAGAVAGRVVGMVAGQAAGLAAAAAVGAAAGPIGWAIDAALALGFGIKAIVDAVNKHKKQQSFDHNVDPTLEQFGIPKAH